MVRLPIPLLTSRPNQSKYHAGVWDGIALGNYTTLEWPIVPEADLQPYIDDVLNEIEFITGNTSTKWGQVRASLGREEPYTLRFIEM